jgi:hypothetical protein
MLFSLARLLCVYVYSMQYVLQSFASSSSLIIVNDHISPLLFHVMLLMRSLQSVEVISADNESSL